MSAVVSKIRLSGELLPDVELADTNAEPGDQGWLVRLVKPKLTIETALGPFEYAPAGEPGPSRWGLVVVALLVVAGLAVYGAIKLFGR